MSRNEIPLSRATDTESRLTMPVLHSILGVINKRRNVVLFVCLLLVAAFLRLYQLDLIDYRYDEALAPLLAMRISTGDFMAVAPFSGSIANHPPLYLYALAFPYLISRDLMWVAAYRVLLDVLAIGLFWWVCKRYFTSRLAWIACMLFAVAPWAIQFARKLWLAPVPLFSVVLLWGLLEVAKKRNPNGWIIVGFGLALCVGTHLSAIYLIPAVVAAAALTWRTLRIKPVLIGLVPILLIGGVYLMHDATVGFSNSTALFGAGLRSASTDTTAVDMALWITGGAHLSDLTAAAYAVWQTQLPVFLNLIDTVQQIILLLGIALLSARTVVCTRRHRISEAAVWLILLSMLCLPVILQVRHSNPLQMHYFTPIYPLPFLVMGFMIDWALSLSVRWRQAVRGVTIVVVLMIVVWQVLTTFRFEDFISRYDTSNGGYGPPVHSALETKAALREMMCGSAVCDYGAGVIVVTPGGDPLVDEQAAIWHTILADIPHRFANSNVGLILRNDNAAYVFTPGTEKVLEKLKTLVPMDQMILHAIPVRAGSGLVYTVVRTSGLDLTAFDQDTVAVWDNGISLVGYKAAGIPNLHLELVLRVDKTPATGDDFHWYNHVLSGTLKIGQLDGGGIQPGNWRKGDYLLHIFDIALSEQLQQGLNVRIGSYQYPSLVGVPVVLQDGSTSDGVLIAVK